MPSTKVLMYSFKGGAGRTVTTANVSYLLAAEFGRRVAVLDLDIESAGLSVLFNLAGTVKKGECWTVQDVLRGFYGAVDDGRDGSTPRESIQLGVRDFEERLWPRLHREIPTDGKGSLRIIPARTMLSAQEVRAGLDGSEVRFEQLLKKIDAISSPPEITLLDSASGMQDAAMLGLDNCHVLVIFMRWSRQFINGTTDFLRRQVCSERYCPRVRRVFVVPTAVPREEPQGRLRDAVDSRQRMLREIIETANERAVRDFGSSTKEWIRLLDPVRECSGLKWDDRVFGMKGDDMFDPEEADLVRDDYRRVAAALSRPTEA